MNEIDSCSKELIFIQGGPASNWLGAHFWNLQENVLLNSASSNIWPPVLYSIKQVSRNNSVPIYHPRLLALDVIGSVGGHRLISSDVSNEMFMNQNIITDYESTLNEHLLFNGNIAEKHTPVSSKYWTDCLHPCTKQRWRDAESILIIKTFLDASLPKDNLASPYIPVSSTTNNRDSWLNSPNYFSSFTQGLNTLSDHSCLFNAFEDRLHPLIEDCDRPSGFVLAIDTDSGFSGIGLRIVEYMDEEFSKRPIFSIPVSSVERASCSQVRWSAICLNRLALFSHLESAEDSSSHLSWLPVAPSLQPVMKSSALPVVTPGPCLSAFMMATSISNVLSPVMVKPDTHKSTDLHEMILSLGASGKRMLSQTLGIPKSSASHLNYGDMRWYHLNSLADGQYENSAKKRKTCQTLPTSSGLRVIVQGSLAHMSAVEIQNFVDEAKSSGLCDLVQYAYPELFSYIPGQFASQKVQNIISSCCQPLTLPTTTLLESPQLSTHNGQWLANSLLNYISSAFIPHYHPQVEIDDLNEIRELSIRNLCDKYISSKNTH